MIPYLLVLCVYSASGAIDCSTKHAIAEMMPSYEICMIEKQKYINDKRVRAFCVPPKKPTSIARKIS